MTTRPLPALWSALVAPILKAIQAGRGQTALVGLSGSAKGFLLSTLSRQFAGSGPSLLIVTPTDETAERLHADAAFFHRLQGVPSEDVLLFPDWGVLPYTAAPPPVEVVGQRMQVLERLRQPKSGLVVIVPVTAFLQRLLPRSILSEAVFTLTASTVIARTPLIVRFLQLGYRQVSVVENPGEFAVRGGIVDLFSTGQTEPHRIEFLGDTVETLGARILEAEHKLYPEALQQVLAR